MMTSRERTEFERNLAGCMRQRDAAMADAATLRRQLEDEQHVLATLDAARAAAIVERDDLRRQCAEERMRANAAEFAVAQLRDDAAELRRQLAEAQAELLHYKTNGVSSIDHGRHHALTWSQRQTLQRAQLMPREHIFCALTMRTRESVLHALECAGYARRVADRTGETWYQLTPAGRAALEIDRVDADDYWPGENALEGDA